MQSKPILIALSLVCLLCVVAVGKLAGEIVFGLTDRADTAALVRDVVIGAILTIAVLLGVSTWRRRSRSR
jgi:hypothetical protein